MVEEQATRLKPDTIRSRVILEAASEIIGSTAWPYRQVQVELRSQGDSDWRLRFIASDTPAVIEDVASGAAQVAIINPAGPLTLALRGTGPFRSPIPLRAIATIPSEDQLAFAVSKDFPLTSLDEIGRRRYPLRVSLRAEMQHSVHFYLREILTALGWSLDDLREWGGEVRYAAWPPDVEAVARGEVDAVFDEAVPVWTPRAVELGMHHLPLGEELLRHLEELGSRRTVIPKASYPGLADDVPTLDFSGWVIYTHADTQDDVVTAVCRALVARRHQIPWQGSGPLPIERMALDGPDTPLDLPLHRAAERYWTELGYLQ
jgi:TRAP-type uncharacterized transport system substrate-binding protein